ncbi:replication-relaxation family protein [Kitasatospora cineracea]|uniref:replication-relaxation family protein n=1 Tax=Kitasatospora cineracea TaxID=88074 RepID=UPI00379D6F5C
MLRSRRLFEPIGGSRANPFRRGAANPNGSTNALRSDVLGALGVLKVATADQLQRLLRPAATSNKAVRQALGDLPLHGLVASDGNTKARHKTWRLEGTAGPEAAGQVLGLPRSDMGSTAQGAERSGAQHAMAVNETVLAFVRGGTAPGAAGGVGEVTDWVALYVSGESTWCCGSSSTRPPPAQETAGRSCAATSSTSLASRYRSPRTSPWSSWTPRTPPRCSGCSRQSWPAGTGLQKERLCLVIGGDQV